MLEPKDFEIFPVASMSATEAECCSYAVVGTTAGVLADHAAAQQAAVFYDADERGNGSSHCPFAG